MGSQSDFSVMQAASDVLKQLEIAHELKIVSCHRTPLAMAQYATTARSRGLSCIIAGAGGAAHLPGMIASHTTLPVIGVPIQSSQSMEGWDSVLSILQMPAGVPVATVALNGAKNAGLLAARILGATDGRIGQKLEEWRSMMQEQVEKSAEGVNYSWP